MANKRLHPRLEPAATIIALLGGDKEVVVGTGFAAGTVERWMRSIERGGTGGMIPHWRHEALYELAKKKGVSLTPAHFYPVPEALAG